MTNAQIADIFYEMADILEMLDVEWKPNAYRKAARSIESIGEELSVIYSKKGIKGLDAIPGVGEGIAKKIIEYIQTGHIKEYEKLLKKTPKGIDKIIHIPGMGPKKTWKLYKKLGINTITKLDSAAKKGKIRKLEGFGIRSETDIIQGIQMLNENKGRQLIGRAHPIATKILNNLRKQKFVKKAEIAGSLRRMKETIKDIDILTTSNRPEQVMEYFSNLTNIKKIIARGKTKTSAILKEGINCDLRVVEEKSFGAAMQYFTGSKEHNVKLRQIAIKKGYKLNEYGLSNKQGKYICGKTEKQIYSKIGVSYPEPEIRENTGELDMKKIPKLISYNSLKGLLHNHTKWSDGDNTPEQIIQAAIKKGIKYFALTDHSKSEPIANGMNEKRLLKYIKEIENLKKKYANKITILSGSEVDILKNGKLDYENKYLKKIDIVIAAVHTNFKMTKKQMTNRIISALNNEHATILAHPTGRLINRRKPYDFDVEKVLQTAKENKIILEINSQPSRLDLKDSHIKLAIEMGCRLCINTDSHSLNDLNLDKYGIGQARRGFARPKDIVNTLSWEKFKKHIK